MNLDRVAHKSPAAVDQPFSTPLLSTTTALPIALPSVETDKIQDISNLLSRLKLISKTAPETFIQNMRKGLYRQSSCNLNHRLKIPELMKSEEQFLKILQTQELLIEQNFQKFSDPHIILNETMTVNFKFENTPYSFKEIALRPDLPEDLGVNDIFTLVKNNCLYLEINEQQSLLFDLKRNCYYHFPIFEVATTCMEDLLFIHETLFVTAGRSTIIWEIRDNQIVMLFELGQIPENKIELSSNFFETFDNRLNVSPNNPFTCTLYHFHGTLIVIKKEVEEDNFHMFAWDFTAYDLNDELSYLFGEYVECRNAQWTALLDHRLHALAPECHHYVFAKISAILTGQSIDLVQFNQLKARLIRSYHNENLTGDLVQDAKRKTRQILDENILKDQKFDEKK